MTGHGGHDTDGGKLGRLYRAVATPVIATRARRSVIFLIVVGVATLAACAFYRDQGVTVKLLPFDNKSELQVWSTCPKAPRWRRPSAC
jgi:hypothetical protein